MLNKHKKIKLFLLLFSTIFSQSCSKPIVINNVFVYLVHESCFSMGSVEGIQWQPVFVNEYSTTVIATPNNGYTFLKWSDGNTNPERSDLATQEHISGPIRYYAYFIKAS